MASNSTRVGVARDILSNRQRVAVTPPSSIPRIQFSSGAAQALRRFSQDLFNTSQRMEDRLDQQAAVEAQVEGGLAGLSGDVSLRDYTTIRGREFNRSAIETFTATLETQSITQAAALRQQFANDPEGLATALDNYHRGVASQLEQISPAAAAGYLHKSTAMGLPMVERARDNAFRLTKDQADAMLVQNQVALNAELDTYAADLFHENPDRSKAAANAIGIVTNDLSRVYNAVDPVSGKPLYSATERAKALAGIRAEVFKTATLSWFERQDDKGQAYLDFVEGDFRIDLNLSGPDFSKMPANVSNAITQAAIRNGVDPDNLATIAFLESGFDTQSKNPRSSAGGLFQFIDSTASDYGLEDRFDADQSADAGARLMKDNKQALRAALGRDPTVGELYLAHQQGRGGAVDLLSNPSMLAVEVVGEDAVRLNGGKPNMTAAQFANLWIKKAEGVAEKQSFGAKDTLSDTQFKAVSAEMRAQINFANQQADRAVRMEEAEIQAQQAEKEFAMTLQLYSGGAEVEGFMVPDLDRGQVVTAVANQQISPEMGESLLKALAAEPARMTDLTVYNEALRRIGAGEDATTFILENQGSLTRAHASSLIAQNRERLDDPEDQQLTSEQRGYLAMMREAIAPEGLLAQLDQGASIRSFEAQDEYRKRVGDGEDASTVARDIIDRSQRVAEETRNTKLQRLLTPRFSVPGQQPGTIDPMASASALEAAFQAGNISPESYARQRALILKWSRIQKGLE